MSRVVSSVFQIHHVLYAHVTWVMGDIISCEELGNIYFLPGSGLDCLSPHSSGRC